MKLTHYILLREDMTIGQKLAQTTHAAGESFKIPPKIRGAPVYAVCLSVKTEYDLLKIEMALQNANIEHVAIREPDEPFCGAITAIGICPVERSKVKKFLSNLPLVR